MDCFCRLGDHVLGLEIVGVRMRADSIESNSILLKNNGSRSMPSVPEAWTMILCILQVRKSSRNSSIELRVRACVTHKLILP